jgi:nicotinamide-nucleotide amidase
MTGGLSNYDSRCAATWPFRHAITKAVLWLWESTAVEQLLEQARTIAAALVARQQTIAIAESSTGGLLSAALLAVPGASAFYLGGGVIYTPRARHRLLGLDRDAVRGLKSASEPYAALLAETIRDRFGASWGLSETGAAGPTGNPYGDAAGHCCFAVAGTIATASTLETGSAERYPNMLAFARAALALLESRIVAEPGPGPQLPEPVAP